MIKKIVKKFTPQQVLSAYHFSLSLLGAIIYKFPSKEIKVIGITGTKGKTTTTELVNTILEKAGYKTAIAGTLRFKIGSDSKPNMLKMTMPGRFFLQKFIRQAVDEKCDYCIIEMTSEGVKTFRHKYIYLDALIFTGLTPEHIEAHGSYENYVQAKLSIGEGLAVSPKNNKVIVVNTDSKEADKFLALKLENKIRFNQQQAKPYTISDRGIEFTFQGEVIKSKLIGSFNLYNLLGALSLTTFLGVSIRKAKEAIEEFEGVAGRMEHIFPDDPKLRGKQKITVIVDYAHTAESLEKVYKTYPDRPKVCVLGGTGGGRDKWKREIMGSIADNHCQEIILTDEDPYDEDPMKIVEEVSFGIKHTPFATIMDRREAIRQAISKAPEDGVVFITGKGTDPYIMGPDGSKIPWSDAEIAKEELTKFLQTK